ncbi:MAG: nicotinate-nicotinamide nucleotide adenylyltransferase, partial [Erysipelotrichaceae bacterium]|nr:nicotinate-nicotinamide nucleotide adenylyltransferase [Erysipelotrichaceae bacterium]
MNRVIFGGSFDPFHSAHLAIVKKLHEFYNADVDILLSKTAHWKEATTSCAERIKMIELATNHLPYVNISTLEIDHNFPYTFLTIKHLREAYPKDKLYFCLGFDQVAKFHLWREPLFIAQNVKLVSFKRRIRSQDEAKAQENIKKYHIEVLDFPLMMVSSTKIRSFKSIEMPLPALEYLLSQKLYFAKHLSNFLVDNK